MENRVLEFIQSNLRLGLLFGTTPISKGPDFPLNHYWQRVSEQSGFKVQPLRDFARETLASANPDSIYSAPSVLTQNTYLVGNVLAVVPLRGGLIAVMAGYINPSAKRDRKPEDTSATLPEAPKFPELNVHGVRDDWPLRCFTKDGFELSREQYDSRGKLPQQAARALDRFACMHPSLSLFDNVAAL